MSSDTVIISGLGGFLVDFGSKDCDRLFERVGNV